jgi:hypothetical protein
MFEALAASPAMLETFTQHSHHYNSSIIFTTQNYFAPSKDRTLIRQTNYKIIFNDPSDQTLIRNISSKIGSPKFLNLCFKRLQELFPAEKYLYLLIDSSKESQLSQMQVRSNIFPVDGKVKPICFFE